MAQTPGLSSSVAHFWAARYGFVPVQRNGVYVMPDSVRIKYGEAPVELINGEYYIPYTLNGKKYYFREGVGIPYALDEKTFNARKAILEQSVSQGMVPFGDTTPIPFDFSKGYVVLASTGEVYQPVNENGVLKFRNVRGGYTLSAPTFYSYARGITQALRGSNDPLKKWVFETDASDKRVQWALRGEGDMRNTAITGVNVTIDNHQYRPSYVGGWLLYTKLSNGALPAMAKSVSSSMSMNAISPLYYTKSGTQTQSGPGFAFRGPHGRFIDFRSQDTSQTSNQPQWNLGGSFAPIPSATQQIMGQSIGGLLGEMWNRVAAGANTSAMPSYAAASTPLVSSQQGLPQNQAASKTAANLAKSWNSATSAYNNALSDLYNAFFYNTATQSNKTASDAIAQSEYRRKLASLLADWFGSTLNWLS